MFSFFFFYPISDFGLTLQFHVVWVEKLLLVMLKKSVQLHFFTRTFAITPNPKCQKPDLFSFVNHTGFQLNLPYLCQWHLSSSQSSWKTYFLDAEKGSQERERSTRLDDWLKGMIQRRFPPVLPSSSPFWPPAPSLPDSPLVFTVTRLSCHKYYLPQDTPWLKTFNGSQVPSRARVGWLMNS